MHGRILTGLQAAKEKVAQEEAYRRQMGMSRGGSRRGGDLNDYPQVGPDGWTVTGSSAPRRAPRRQTKVGDLSNFGKISKAQPMTFGPSSVLAGKIETEESVSRTASSSNMLSMLSSWPTSPAPEMSEDSAMKKIAEDVEEFFNIRDTQGSAYFTELPHEFHSKLVEKLVAHAVEAKEAEARLVSNFFSYAASKDICPSESFEEGFVAIAEIIDDIIYDAPKALNLFAIVIKGARLDESRLSNIASKSSDNSDALLGLLHYGAETTFAQSPIWWQKPFAF